MNEPEQRLEPGHRLDRYELLCPIAQGGMASVWLARQHGKHGFEKLVAVKTILPLYAHDFRFQQMFLDEARIASGIEHPNVAQILDLGDEGDVLYLAMEWVDGDSLSKLFRAAEKAGTRLPVGIICRVLADTCAGLHAAHELRDKSGELLNVVHRDVSPQNILVSTKGQVKLIDFGIAKARDRVAGDTNTGMLKGKILYMAPEQALGRPVDRRADVWAIGAVLYHMLAGVPPFEGVNQLATLHMLTVEDPPPPLPAHVPPQVAEVVARTLVKDVSKRVATAEEVQQMLEAAMSACGLTANQSALASFLNKQLSERVEARRKAVDLALEAAKQRAKLQQMLKPADPDSTSGMGQALRTRAASTPEAVRLASLSVESADDVPSSATLGSAAVVAPRPSLAPRGKRLAIVGGVLGACALVAAMALGVAVARMGHDTTSTAAPTPPRETTVQETTAPRPNLHIPPPPPIESVVPAAMTTTVASAAPPPPTVTTSRPQPTTTATAVRPKPTATSTKTAVSSKTIDDGF